jgi:uncharacterized membrane protein
MDERRIHKVFEISVLLKGAHALIEILGGLALYLVSTATIQAWVNFLTQEELHEDPNDFIASRLLDLAQNFSISSKAFFAFYRWSYPASLAALVLFIAYQLYRYSYTQSFGLIVLTVFDVVVIALIWHEYRLIRHRLK